MNSTADRHAWVNLRTTAGWLSKAWDLGQALRPQTRSSHQLFVIGTPTYDPWHVAAHLDDEAKFAGLPALKPTLLRWNPPLGAPAHLAHSFAELRDASGAPTVLVVAPDAMQEDELERLADARRQGASLFAVCAQDGDLTALAHEAVTLPGEWDSGAQLNSPFEVATHLLAVSAGTSAVPRPRGVLRKYR